MTQQQFIDSLLEDGRIITQNVKEKFLGLSDSRLNHRPAPESWSAAECFKHLYDTNKSYLQKAEELFPKAPKLNNDIKIKHSFLARFILKFVSPQAKGKYKTSNQFNPIGSNLDSKIVKDFLDQHKKILDAIESGRNIDLTKTKVVSPFANRIKYNFADAFKIVIEHNKRHINQAERAAKME